MRWSTWLCLPLLGLSVASAATAADTDGSDLRFEVSGFDSSKGTARCALFDGTAWFDKDKRLRGVVAKIEGGRATCLFEDLPPGRYATVAFHDENGNEKLDRNFLGVPSEDFCFSRGATGGMGPPKFADAAFEVKKGPVTTSCKL